VLEGIQAVQWPGRFQIVQAEGPTWVFDVAHNEAGVHALRDTFLSLKLPKPVALLVGILGDKDWARMLPPLFDLGDHVVLSIPPTAPPNRVWDPVAVLTRMPVTHAAVELDFTRAIARVQELVGSTGTILVTGSFHTVGDAQAILGWSEVEPDFPLPHKVFPG
jgi:dihydrofolate synthase/folylpolyglutamate synthase